MHAAPAVGLVCLTTRGLTGEFGQVCHRLSGN